MAKTILGTTTNYLYDGPNPVQELSDSTVTVNLLTGLGVDERFTRTDSSPTGNFLTDALGSALALTDGSGNTLASYTYEPFGNTTASGSSSNSYQYTGRENDGTAVYFYRNRYYSPSLQRFISEDPIEFGGGVNLYQYAASNPTAYKDPFGYAPGDNWYGYNDRDFQNWFHRDWKQPGDPDATKDEIEEAYKAWKQQGSPTRDPKADRRQKCDQPQEEPEPAPEPEPEPKPDPEPPISKMINWVENHPVVVGVGIVVVGGVVIVATGGAAGPVVAGAAAF